MAEFAAATGAENVNEWCRKVVLERIATGDTLTKNERLLYEEIARLRYLTGHGFRLLAVEELDQDSWENVRATANAKGREIADELMRRAVQSRVLNGETEGGEDEEE
jgi:hypothetical protein